VADGTHWRERSKTWLLPLAVFVVALLALCGLAGRERLGKPSHDNHYVHLASGWLDGRLALEDKPPGWCTPELRRQKKCKQHSFDDWARVWTLELRDGTTVRGYPCKTQDCEALRREGIEGWLPLGTSHELREIRSREIKKRSETWYVSFPPGPAVAMLPFVAVHGLDTRDVLLTCVLAALIPVVLLQLFQRERGSRPREHLLAVAAWTFASPAAFVGAHGRVWFTAQICGALCLCLYLSSGWNFRRPAWAGLWLGLAVACRPHLLFALPFVLGEWWRETSGRARWTSALRFCVPLALVGVALMAHNYARFEDPMEFGHRFLEIRWQQRMQEIGSFSSEYLPRNLRCAFSLMPVWRDGSWDGRLPRVSLHGSSIFLGAPWVLALAFARDRFPQRWSLLLSAVAVAVPSLLYHNSGQMQFSYRFAIDWLPMLLVAIVFGGGAKRHAFALLVGLGAIWELYGAWMYGRRPGHLFVTDPLGWPFESELE
jgi:hypothetical protein